MVHQKWRHTRTCGFFTCLFVQCDLDLFALKINTWGPWFSRQWWYNMKMHWMIHKVWEGCTHVTQTRAYTHKGGGVKHNLTNFFLILNRVVQYCHATIRQCVSLYVRKITSIYKYCKIQMVKSRRTIIKHLSWIKMLGNYGGVFGLKVDGPLHLAASGRGQGSINLGGQAMSIFIGHKTHIDLAWSWPKAWHCLYLRNNLLYTIL